MTKSSVNRRRRLKASIDTLNRMRDIARVEYQTERTRAAIADADQAIAAARESGFWAEGLADQVTVLKAQLLFFESQLIDARTAAGLDDPDPVASPREHVGHRIARHLDEIGITA